MGLGERAGSGLPKIKQGWMQAGNQLTLFEKQVPYDTTEMSLSWQKQDEGTNDGINEGINEGLNDADALDQQILVLLTQQPTLTVVALASRLGKSQSTLERNIRQLKKLGKLKRVGSNKSGYWEVEEK